MRKAKLLAWSLTCGGALSFLVGWILDGPSGDPVGIRFGLAGVVLLVAGVGTFGALLIMRLRRGDW